MTYPPIVAARRERAEYRPETEPADKALWTAIAGVLVGLTSEQDIQRAGAPVPVWRRREGQDLLPLRQPLVQLHL